MTNCQNCGSRCVVVLDLGNQPICNRYMESKSEFKDEVKYPLGLVFCPKCSLVQLPVSLPTDLVFDKNFNYLSGSSKDGVAYFTRTANELAKKYKLTGRDFVLDIGSNDGTFLKPLGEDGIQVIGVDPAPKPVAIANENGVYTLVGQFENLADRIKRETKGHLRLITAFNVMAHTSSIHKFLEKVEELLSANPGSEFVSGSHYLPNLIEKGEWDVVYHEHQRFYTASSIQALFSNHHMYIYDCYEDSVQGGSIVVFASLSKKPMTKRCKRIMASEARFKKIGTYKQFNKKVNSRKAELLKLLNTLKKQKKHIVGIGAPMKSSTLLNYCGIGTKYLDALTEVNKLKIGRYSPGMHIKVVNEDEWLMDGAEKTDYALILSWNLADTIMKNLKNKGYNGKFIVPLPKLKVV